MAQQFDIVGNLLLKVDGAEAGVNKLRNSLSKLKLPNNIDSDLKKSFSNLDGLFSKYKSQLQNGFKTKTDVSGFTKTAKEINAEYDKITKKISQLNNTNVTFNIKNDSIIAAEKNLNKLLETQKKLTQDTKSSIEKELAAVTKAGSRSTNVKDISSQLSTAINTGDMQKAVELAQQLKTKMVELKSAQTNWAKSGSTISLSDTLDKIVAACQKGAQGFDGLEKETKEAAQVLANLQAGDLEKINQLLDGMSGDWDKSTSAMKAASGEMEAYAGAAQSAVQQVKDLQQSTQYFFSLRNMINLLKRGIREAVDVVKELDAAMTETAVVTDFSVGDMWQKLPEYTANANALGASVKDMYEATTLYYQQGLRTEAAMGIANETMKMARIGGLDAADATDKMTAALRGFNMEINEASAQRVNDVYSNLAAKTASDTEELGTAMQRTASIAASAGMSFEGTAAFLAQAIETTREPAENLGTAMKTIVARFTELKKNPLEITEVDGEEVSYNKVDTALQSIGVSLKDANGQFRDLDKVFLDISKRWDSLTQTQQRYVATTAAGSRQQSRFIAMMSNYERTMQLMDYANNSAGASNEQFGKTMESLEAKLNKLKNAWNQFLMGIMNDSWTKKIVDGTTTAIDQINNLINLLSGGGKLKGVKSFLSLFTAFMGLKFAGGLANFGIGKLGKLVDPTAKKGALNLDGTKGIASKITTPIVAKLNELIAVTKGQKTSDKAISSTLAGYKNATNLLRMPQTMGTTRSTFGQLSDEHAYAAYINSPGTTSAMKRTAMQWLNAKQLGPEMQKTGEQLMDSIFKGMDRKQIPIKKGTKLIGKPELWGEYLGTETAKSFSDNFIKIQKTRETQQAKQIADARKQAWAQAGGDPYASDAVKELQYKTNANGIKDRYLQAYKQIRQQQKEAFGGSLNTKAINPKPYEQLANRVGTLGSNFTAAGYSMQMFGAQLGQLSPGLTDVGNLISRLGIAVSTFGMGFSGMGNVVTKVGAQITKGIEAARLVKYGDTIGALVNSGQVAAGGMIASAGAKAAGASGAQVAGGFVSGFLNGIPKPLLVAGLIAAVGGAILAIHKHIEKQAQEAGKKVRESFEENFTKSDDKINSLEEYKNRFNELSKGVDQFGHNINLSAEEYDEYLNISKELQQLSPSLIAGYNAEGEAIIKKGNAIQEVIDGLKKAKQEELDLFTKDSSINKLIGEYKTSDVYKNNHTDAASPINRGYSNFAQERIDIAELKDSNKLVNSINQLTGWNLNSLSNLTTSQLSWLSKHYSDVIGLVEEQNGKLSDEVKDGYIDAFANAGSAIDEVMTEGQPIIDAMQQWMGLEGIDAVGLGLGEEFGNSFNEGLQGIMLTGLSEGWSADTFKSNIRDYANEWDELAGSTSKYADIMEDAKDVQDEYLDAMGSDNAIENYNSNITESCNKLIELANNTDTATAAGQAFQQQCIAQANALRNYATEGGMSLSEALNTATDDIQRAEAALDNFNEATKTDLYTAAEGMKSIYDKAFETYKDSFGGEYEKHFEGKGDHTAWEAGRTILGEEALESIPDGQALKNKLKEWEPALREGEEGWYNFWTKITGDSKLMDDLNKIDGVHWDEDDFYIPDSKWAEVAKTIGISEEMLTSMLNKGRQFADIDFTNWKEARHTFETSNVGIEGTAETENKNGQRKLYIKEETFEAALADANYKPEEYEGKKEEAREQQNFEFLKGASEYNKQELRSVFEEGMGINNLQDLISTLIETGDYTKDEIEDYAEKAGYEGDFEGLYAELAEAMENPELAKQTGVLETISAQIAALADTRTGEEAKADYDEAHKKLVGKEGFGDTDAQAFAMGKKLARDENGNVIYDKNGKAKLEDLTAGEFEQTKKSMQETADHFRETAAIAKEKAKTAPESEKSYWEAVQKGAEEDAARADKYVQMADEAMKKQEDAARRESEGKAKEAKARDEARKKQQEAEKAAIEKANKDAQDKGKKQTDYETNKPKTEAEGKIAKDEGRIKEAQQQNQKNLEESNKQRWEAENKRAQAAAAAEKKAAEDKLKAQKALQEQGEIAGQKLKQKYEAEEQARKRQNLEEQGRLEGEQLAARAKQEQEAQRKAQQESLNKGREQERALSTERLITQSENINQQAQFLLSKSIDDSLKNAITTLDPTQIAKDPVQSQAFSNLYADLVNDRLPKPEDLDSLGILNQLSSQFQSSLPGIEEFTSQASNYVDNWKNLLTPMSLLDGLDFSNVDSTSNKVEKAITSVGQRLKSWFNKINGIDSETNINQPSTEQSTTSASTPQETTSKYTVDTSEGETNVEGLQTKVNETSEEIERDHHFGISVESSDLAAASKQAAKISKASSKTNVIKTEAATPDLKKVDEARKKIEGKTSKIPIGVKDKTSSGMASIRSGLNLSTAYIPVKIEPQGSTTITVKAVAKGQNNFIKAATPLSFGSAAKGKYGTLGPKDKGGLTLTGEKGFEIAWLPSENRSTILGVGGPQMVNLPSDAVVYTHEQSKEILKRKGIPAGSHSAESKGAYDPNSSRYADGGGGGGGAGKHDKHKDKDDKRRKKNTDDAAKVIKKAGKISAWWWNMGKKVEATQRIIDKTYKKIDKLINKTGITINDLSKNGNLYINKLQQQISLNTKMKKKAEKGLTTLDQGTKYDKKATAARKKVKAAEKKLKKAKKTKSKKDDKEARQELKKAKRDLKKAKKLAKKKGGANYATISYDKTIQKGKKKTKKPKKEKINLSPYIKKDKATGAYVIDEAKINKQNWDKSKKKAVMEAAQKKLEDKVNKQNTAEDNIEKNREALDDLSEKLYEAFYAWENELTKIYFLTNKIAEAEGRVSGLKTLEELQTNRLLSGFRDLTDSFKRESLLYFQTAARGSVQNIKDRNNLIDLKKQDVQDKLLARSQRAEYISLTEQYKTEKDPTKQLALRGALNKLGEEINAISMAQQFIKPLVRSDGTIDLQFDTEAWSQQKGQLNTATAEAIQKYIKDIEEANQEIISLYEEQISDLNEMHAAVVELEQKYADYSEELLKAIEDEAQERVDKIKALSDVVSNSFKELIDKVKEQLEQRRQEEDNAKTERDIVKKQNRLALLRANASGGNVVAAAQLEQEIADAQQSYGRTLEDQLLDRLQNSSDKAERQREEQIKLATAMLELNKINGTNVALVTEYLKNPDRYQSRIIELIKDARGYNEATEQSRVLIDGQIKQMLGDIDPLTGIPTKVDSLNDAIRDAEVELAKTLKEFLGSAGAAFGVDTSEITGGLGGLDPVDPDDIKADPALTAAQAEVAYKNALLDAEANKATSYKEIHDTLMPLGKATGRGTARILQDLANTPGITWKQILTALKGKYNRYRLALTFTSDAFQKAYNAVYKSDAKGKKTAYQVNRAHGHEKGPYLWKYAKGGLANYTGPAWLDGTPSKPELVLDATDTKNLIALKDILGKVMKGSLATTTENQGDILYEININVDRIEKDYDVDQVVDKVKKEIVKSAGYRNVTQVRNLR